MATKLRVKYADGREVQVIASPRAQVMTERNFGGITEARKVEASYYLAWASLNKSGQEAADFDAWLDLVEEVEEAASEEPSPTQPAQSGTTSSD